MFLWDTPVKFAALSFTKNLTGQASVKWFSNFNPVPSARATGQAGPRYAGFPLRSNGQTNPTAKQEQCQYDRNWF